MPARVHSPHCTSPGRIPLFMTKTIPGIRVGFCLYVYLCAPLSLVLAPRYTYHNKITMNGQDRVEGNERGRERTDRGTLPQARWRNEKEECTYFSG